MHGRHAPSLRSRSLLLTRTPNPSAGVFSLLKFALPTEEEDKEMKVIEWQKRRRPEFKNLINVLELGTPPGRALVFFCCSPMITLSCFLQWMLFTSFRNKWIAIGEDKEMVVELWLSELSRTNVEEYDTIRCIREQCLKYFGNTYITSFKKSG